MFFSGPDWYEMECHRQQQDQHMRIEMDLLSQELEKQRPKNLTESALDFAKDVTIGGFFLSMLI